MDWKDEEENYLPKRIETVNQFQLFILETHTLDLDGMPPSPNNTRDETIWKRKGIEHGNYN